MKRLISKIGTGAVLLAVLLLTLFAPATAQAAAGAIKGSYVFAEQGTLPSGQPAVGLAILNFAENGTVVGVRAARTMSGVVKRNVQGAYVRNSDNSGSLTLTTVYSDQEENPQAISESYKLLFGESGEIKAVRSCLGYYSVARLAPLAQATVLSGSYIFGESVIGQPFARIGQVKIDTAGNADGLQIVVSNLLNGSAAMKGSVRMLPDGFGCLTLSTVITNGEGESISVVENYLFASTGGEVWLMRADNGPFSLVTLIR